LHSRSRSDQTRIDPHPRPHSAPPLHCGLLHCSLPASRIERRSHHHPPSPPHLLHYHRCAPPRRSHHS
ncbi:hypothetical protein PMAYCL1PPCAC_10979, partial [Pristionchus mayeri]